MNPNLEEFTKVSYKRKSKIKKKTDINNGINSFADRDLINIEVQIRRIQEAKAQLLSTDLLQSVCSLLKEGLTHLDNPIIDQIVCFGLGHISELTVPRYQFALLLYLKDHLRVDVTVSDPIFNKNDIGILRHFNVGFTEENIEAKFEISCKNTTIFYLPHCPKQLTNNLLWANWNLNLSKCIIIGNSICKVVEDNSSRKLSKLAKYVTKICPYVLELGIVNSFEFFEVFNDTSMHFFPIEKLKLLTKDFWEDKEEPQYSDDDVEFIRNGLENKVNM